MSERNSKISLAAPSKADLATLKAMSREERLKFISSHVETGLAEIADGRYTELKTDSDIDAFLDEIWSLDEAPVI